MCNYIIIAIKYRAGWTPELKTKVREDFTTTDKAISWLKSPTSAFTLKTLLRHYAKQALT